ncbi:MAG: OmpH family outer membrane protein [Haliscomenobacter sp.]|nr:OmpH family outer membrane protein [Haliscomenobacter sp.]MBK7475175.1 OmpH family outer membrane protein [Haliscomenobacter sp.]MBK8879715.1 OmpH family outer membrane protein [Haliscomenobacter sp.]
MKHWIKNSALAMAFLTLALVGAQAQKFGYVNSAALIAELPEVKQADATIEALQKQLQKKGQEMVQKFQADYAEVQRKADNGELSPKQQEEEAKRLEAEQTKIEQFEQESMQQIQAKRNELLKPIYDKVNQAMKEVAEENGFQFIFDQSVLLYFDPTADATPLIKKKLGIS